MHHHRGKQVAETAVAPRKREAGEPPAQRGSEVLATRRLVAPLTTNTPLAEGEGSRGGFIQALRSAPGDGTTVLRVGMSGIFSLESSKLKKEKNKRRRHFTARVVPRAGCRATEEGFGGVGGVMVDKAKSAPRRLFSLPPAVSFGAVSRSPSTPSRPPG